MLGKISVLQNICCAEAVLTLKRRETHEYVLSAVATDVLVLKHQAISIHSAD